MVNAKGRTAAKSCRRALNFDVEKIVDESQELAVGQQELPHWNKGAFSLSSDSRATELCPGTYSVSGTKSVVQIEQWTGLMEEQQQSGNINDLIHSTSQLQTNYVPLQQRQAAAASLAPEKDWSVEDPHVIGRNIDERYSDPFQNSSERCNHSMTAGQNLLMQEISSDLRSHAEVTKETSRLTSVHGYPCLAAIEDCYMLQPSPPKQVPELENQVVQTSHVPDIITLFTGDRRFSRWKGSVVDSVIGVFLTQNVSDHLSSSAFMSLAARFPLGSTEHQTDSETTGRERSIVDAHSQSMGEDVISSQDSFDSLNVQGPGGPRSSSGSNSEEEDFITGCRPSEIHFPTLTNLLQMEKTTFKEFYSQNTCSLVDEESRQVHKQSKNIVHAQKIKRLDRADDFNGPFAFTYPSSDYHLHINPEFRIAEVENFKAFSEESISPLPSIDVRFTKTKDENSNGFRTEGWAGSEGGRTVQQNELLCSQETQRMGPSIPLSNHSVHQESISKPGPRTVYDLLSCHNHQLEMNKFLQLESPSVAEPVKLAEALAKRQNNSTQQIPSVPKVTENAGERISVENKQMQMHLENRFIKPNSNEQAYSFGHTYDETSSKISKAKKGRTESDKTSAVDWDSLRKQVHASSRNIERSKDTQDSLDYEAIRLANVAEISKAIKERGMNNMLAERIKVHVLEQVSKAFIF